ncbi:MAG: hypothetical protein R8K22_00370 [Mariprofundaceae bacterium]
MKFLSLFFFFLVSVSAVEASPKYVTVAVDELPEYISVDTSKLGSERDWYGFSVQVNLEHPSASYIGSWTAQLAVLDEKRNYLLTAPLQRSQTKDGIAFWSTVQLSLLKNAIIELRDNNNFIVYQIKLWTSKGIQK